MLHVAIVSRMEHVDIDLLETVKNFYLAGQRSKETIKSGYECLPIFWSYKPKCVILNIPPQNRHFECKRENASEYFYKCQQFV